MSIESIRRILFIEANQNTVTIFHGFHSNNTHFKNMLNKRTTKLTKIRICHVIWYSQNTRQWLPSNLIQKKKKSKLKIQKEKDWIGKLKFMIDHAYRKRRRVLFGEDMHEAASFFDSRVSRREIKERSWERRRFSLFFFGDDSAWTPHRYAAQLKYDYVYLINFSSRTLNLSYQTSHQIKFYN